MPARPKRPSIAEVAAAAGVSLTTVSHVRSGRRPVSADTAARVHAAMRALEYVPSHAAQSLARGSTRTIGLVVADISSPYFGELAKGVDDAANDLGFSVLLANTNWDAEREARSVQQLISGHTDGLIYAAGAPLAPARLRQLTRDFPLVVVDESIEGLDAPAIVSDNREGGRLVGEHLAALGHAEALYLGGPAALPTSRTRLAGFREGFAYELRADAPIETRFADYRLEGGRQAVADALEGGRRWTAIFAGNDLMAMGAVEALRSDGIRVPEDVSVAGFDDTVLARHFRPRLTTVRQPAHELGRTAAETLIVAISRGERPSRRHVMLGVSLVAGESTAPATSGSRRLSGNSRDAEGPGAAVAVLAP